MKKLILVLVTTGMVAQAGSPGLSKDLTSTGRHAIMEQQTKNRILQPTGGAN